jgi:hypothetical protein
VETAVGKAIAKGKSARDRLRHVPVRHVVPIPKKKKKEKKREEKRK